MPSWSNIADLTTNNLPNMGGSGRQSFRVSNAVNTYTPGTVCQLAAIDSQVLPDFQTVIPMAAAANGSKFAGVVQVPWNGFDNAGNLNASYISVASQLNSRGTVYCPLQVKGVAYIWVDNASGTTITDGIPLTSSANTAGYAQGVAKASALPTILGYANLPASGIGSSLANAALVQASQTFTVAGTPAAGDVLTVTIQAPYTDLQPGTAQTNAVSVTLNSTTAATVTTAAAALVVALNASPYFQVQTVHGVGSPPPYFIPATNSAGVVTVTVNTLANPFLVTGGSTNAAGTAIEQWRYYIGISGVVANSLTTAASVSAGAGSTLTAGGANFASGAGYKGKIPAIILGMY